MKRWSRTGISGRATALLTSPIVLEIDPDTRINAVHDLAVGRGGLLYVAETRTKRVVKLRPARR
jgi:hypothetical protein